jgi:hypothetical protein
MRKPLSLLSAIGSAPIAALLAVFSVGVTLVVAVSTVTAGQVPGNAGLELIGALVLAAVAVSEASRPQRRDRDRRGRTEAGQDAHTATVADRLWIGPGADGE